VECASGDRLSASSCYRPFRHRSTKARSTLATMSKQHCQSNRQLCCLLLRQYCFYGQQCRSNVQLCRQDEISTQNSFDIVSVSGNKVERCFDIVIGVDGALSFPLRKDERMQSFRITSRLYHRLRGSASPVLTATGFVNGKGNFRPPQNRHPSTDHQKICHK